MTTKHRAEVLAIFHESLAKEWLKEGYDNKELLESATLLRTIPALESNLASMAQTNEAMGKKLLELQAEIEALKSSGEPVAWRKYHPDGFCYLEHPAKDAEPLYTRPAKTLTDEEIDSVWHKDLWKSKTPHHDFARAILKKASGEPVAEFKFPDAEDYVGDYEMDCDTGIYHPNEHERFLIADALMGYISDLPKLYTRPAKTLTDEEIIDSWFDVEETNCISERQIAFARVLLKKAGEK